MKVISVFKNKKIALAAVAAVAALIIAASLVLASCGTAGDPPTVDETYMSGHIVIYDGAAEVSNKVFYSYTEEDCSMDKEIAFLKEFDAAL